ncbi:hypothetical protein JDV02_001661 [Purpureocillium takamizusanense]|uniref:Uncharacterized protein n=1 Tax=Purpureocillium takamizusanense TaxID=2060973 RepID=A0A9Q8V7S4_9HYPO|nr:uncharacterized protein JDV02_001661 [Purpureocillium takamizusanense]UNI15092.1 hypothetical protein JDV02_001661 [Purpureocillium takamizusanense]
MINWDHCGEDARIAYTTGHEAAIEHAANGRKSRETLFEAYVMNAFADHYLQDFFLAGYLRVPRRLLYGMTGMADKLAQYMHDEDSAFGLQVEDASGSRWTAFGDRKLLDKVNEVNLLKCQAAAAASAREVYDA